MRTGATAASGIARITINNPERRNCYDPPMREQLGAYLDELAIDDAVKVVLLRGEGGDLLHRRRHGQRVHAGTTEVGRRRRRRRPRRPSQRRRLAVDRKTFGFYHELHGLPEGAPSPRSAATRSAAGSSWRSMADIAVVGRDAVTRHARDPRSSVPRSASLHLFFHRLGPVLTRRLLLTGDTVTRVDASSTSACSPRSSTTRDVEARAAWWAAGRSPRCRPTASSWPRRRSASSSSSRPTRAKRWRRTAPSCCTPARKFEDDEFNFGETAARSISKCAVYAYAHFMRRAAHHRLISREAPAQLRHRMSPPSWTTGGDRICRGPGCRRGCGCRLQAVDLVGRQNRLDEAAVRRPDAHGRGIRWPARPRCSCAGGRRSASRPACRG